MDNLTRITVDDIKRGFNDGLVRLIDAEQHGGDGVACEIGSGGCSNWFYFAGYEGECMTASEYMRDVPLDEIAKEIEAVLYDFWNGDDADYDEWLFYRHALNK